MTDIFSILIAFSNFYFPVAVIPAILLGLGFNFNKASIMSGVFCGMAATLINYLITKDPNSYFLGMIAHLVGLLSTELFVRMKKKNDDKDTVTSKV
jgi:Na+/proline symporter